MSGAGGGELRKQFLERRMAGVPGLVMKALRGNPDPLIAYFRNCDQRQLSGDDCESLASLLEEKLPRKNGRPRGSVTPKNAATACASYLVRHGKRRWRLKHGRQRVPKAVVERLSERAIELAEPEFPSARGKIRVAAVIDESCSKRCEEMGQFVAEYLDEAKWEIIELALK